MEDFNNRDNNYYEVKPVRNLAAELNVAMIEVYLCMFAGLLITAISAFAAYAGELFVVESRLGASMVNEGLFYGLIIGEIAIVLAFSFLSNKVSTALNLVLFVLYSVVNGLTLSVIFNVYALGSIWSAFLVTCITFGGMSLFGFITKRNFNTVGHYCFMGLFGIIIAGVINIFIMNDMFSFMISAIGLLVFIGLTAYDTQKIKERLSVSAEAESHKIAIWGALTLYLDFINIFLKILRFTGKRK